MPRKLLPLHELKGLKGISYEHAELTVFNVFMGNGSAEEIVAVYGDSAHFRVMHDWLLEAANSAPINAAHPNDAVKPLITCLADALLDLANGKEAEFLKPKKRGGRNNQDKILRQAVSASAALFAAEQMHGRQDQVQRWWARLIKKHNLDTVGDLKSYISNVAGQDGVTEDKRLLLAAHALFARCPTLEQHKACAAAIKEMVESIASILDRRIKPNPGAGSRVFSLPSRLHRPPMMERIDDSPRLLTSPHLPR